MFRILGLGLIWLTLQLSSVESALAGVMELSANFSYNVSNYSDISYSWTRRVGLSLGYYFWAQSELEISVQDVLYRTKIINFEDTSFHDQIYSLDWVQMLTPQYSDIQPYFKVGIGQLNREATGAYVSGGSPPAIYDSITGVLGVGFKFHISRLISFRVEGSTYLLDGSIASCTKNFGLSSGLSIYF